MKSGLVQRLQGHDFAVATSSQVFSGCAVVVSAAEMVDGCVTGICCGRMEGSLMLRGFLGTTSITLVGLQEQRFWI